MTAKKTLISNSLAVIFNRLTQGIATFVISSAIARLLGAYQLGQYVLAISYYYIFVNIVSQGLKTLFTREIAKDSRNVSDYLVSGSFLQLILSLIGYAILSLLIFILPYSNDTDRICYIMGLTLIPFALSNITEAIFQAQEKMYLITVSTVPVYILRLLIMIWLMQMKYGVDYVAGIMVASESLILIIQWIILAQDTNIKWQIDRDFIVHNIKASRTFFAIEGIGIIAAKIDVLMLSLLGNVFLVGLYGSIGQLMQPFSIIAKSVGLAAFPSLSKSVLTGRQEQRRITENILEMLLFIALPFFVGLLFLGSDLLIFIYKDPDFSQATIPLYLTALTLISYPFIKVLGYTLIANGFERFNLIEVISTTTFGGLSGILLITHYKLIGAALMLNIMSLAACGLLLYVVYTQLFKLRLWKIFRQPLLLTGLMTIVFLILKQEKIEFLYSLLIATVSYIIFAGLFTAKTLGFETVRNKFASKITIPKFFKKIK